MNLAAFSKRLRERFFLRWHMSLVMLATVLSGLCFARLLYWAGLHSMAWRFPLVLLLSYGCFLLLIRLLLIYLTKSFPQGGKNANSSWMDALGYSGGSSGGGGSAEGPSLFQGGSSGGGGASGSFADSDSPAPVAALVPASSSGVEKSASDAAGEVVSGLGDSDGWVLLAVGLIVVAVLGSSVFIIYEAPVILSEAAFQVLLAGGLMRKARQGQSEDWLGSIWRHTWKPFALAMALTVAAGVLLARYCPQAHRISEVIQLCL